MSRRRVTREECQQLLDGNLPLAELRTRYPDFWDDTVAWMATALGGRRPAEWHEPFKQLRDRAAAARQRIDKSRWEPHALGEAFPHLVRLHMARQALESCYLAATGEPVDGVVRFRFLNGYILQKLLFRRHFERKPASLRWFRFWWRFVGQKPLLMHFAQKQGIYCFYTRELVQALKREIGARSCIEIAAGDGTLARFLNAAGVPLRASDNATWGNSIAYPVDVERLDAQQALDKYRPEAVLCSWPPPFNHFEAAVFAAPSVQLYIVIGSSREFATGNWQVYARQSGFAWERRPELAELVLPPELGNAVFIFRRQS